MNDQPPTFHVRDCTLTSIATGIVAESLTELRDRLMIVPISSIYFHFWGGRLRTSFEHREYHNDFSYFAHKNLHDDILAERLEIVDPTDYPDIENLRWELVEIIENRLDEREVVPFARSNEQFHFVESKIIVFDTHFHLNHPKELVKTIPLMTTSSLFYHFIDSARRIPDKNDDFTIWLEGYQNEFQELIKEIANIDPYFISLTVLKLKLTHIVRDFFLKHGIADGQ